MKGNNCPHCRRSMRLWALEARQQPKPDFRLVCVRTAVLFRDECLHEPAQVKGGCHAQG